MEDRKKSWTRGRKVKKRDRMLESSHGGREEPSNRKNRMSVCLSV